MDLRNTSLFFIISYLLIITLSIVGLVFAITFIFLILIHRQSHTVRYLLSINVVLTSSIYFLIVLYNHINGLFYHTLSPMSCIIVSYIMSSSAASISYSLMLQSLSQLIFIIFYRNKYLLSFKFHFLILFLSWMISYTFVPIPCALLKGFIYDSSLYLCILNTNLVFVIVYAMFTGCLIPFSIIGFIYYYIMFYLHKKRSTNVVPLVIINNYSTRKKIDRNLVVLRSIMINVKIMSVTGLPSFIILILLVLKKATVTINIYCTLFTLFGVVLMTMTTFFLKKSARKIFFNCFRSFKIN